LSFDSRDDAAIAPPLSSHAGPEDRVVFVRHRRARRYIMRVSGDGTVRVTLPPRGTLREARAFVAAQHAWIARQRRRVSGRRPSGWLREHVERWYRARAERELPAQLLALAAQHGIPVARVRVLNQRSRWGACSARGVITLNWRLIRVPAFVREYVLIHELMHRRELNHSRRFWHLVSACCTRHAEARRWLREEGKLLWADCE
jgi:predicted metal-dependent hydrolase